MRKRREIEGGKRGKEGESRRMEMRAWIPSIGTHIGKLTVTLRHT